MVKKELPKYCYRFGKRGLIYYRKDGALHRMPDDPSSEEFAREYAKLRSGRMIVPAKRNMGKLIGAFMASPEWKQLAANTQKSYRQAFRYIEDRIGYADPRVIKRSDVIAMRDRSADKPTTGNRRVAALSVLLNYAMNLDWIESNVAKGIPNLPASKPPRKAWPQELVAKARDTAKGDTLLIFEMLLGTGQRITDVLNMRWDQIEDDGIWVVPQKTKRKRKRLYVPFTARLKAVIDKTPRYGDHIISQPNGNPIAYQTAWKRMMELRTAIGAKDYDNHALRHTAASEIIALPGMTREHVEAITGHGTADMVDLYAGDAGQKARATEAQKARK